MKKTKPLAGAGAGAKDARDASYPAIKARVFNEYADELKTAGFIRRLQIGWRIRREIQRRVREAAASRAP